MPTVLIKVQLQIVIHRLAVFFHQTSDVLRNDQFTSVSPSTSHMQQQLSVKWQVYLLLTLTTTCIHIRMGKSCLGHRSSTSSHWTRSRTVPWCHCPPLDTWSPPRTRCLCCSNLRTPSSSHIRRTASAHGQWCVLVWVSLHPRPAAAAAATSHHAKSLIQLPLPPPPSPFSSLLTCYCTIFVMIKTRQAF